MGRMSKLALLGFLLAGSLLAADVTGTWSGPTKVKTPDGETVHDSVWMALKQSGSTVTGTAGPGADRQAEIKDGRVDGDQVQFKVAVGEATATVRLTFAGDTLRGNAEVQSPDGKLVIGLDLKRLP